MEDQHRLDDGASSDVTSPSTNEQLKKYEETIKRLETENKSLHGRIRGYKTLGDLLQEAKENNKKLTEEKRKLEELIDVSPEVKLSLTQVQLEPIQSLGKDPEYQDLKRTLNTSPVTDVREPVAASSKMIERSVSNRDTDSNEETEGSIREITAMQESINETQNDLSRSLPKKTSTSETNISLNLEPDSDRYEEPEYEKVGSRMGAAGSRTGAVEESMGSMSVISSPDDKYTFPSLSSGTPHRGQETDQKTYNDFDTKPMSSMHDSELSYQMRRVLQQQHTTEEPELFRKMHEDIAKTEEDVKRYKNLAFTFAQENQKMKTSLMMEMKQIKAKNFELREENKRLLTRIKKLEHDRDDLTVTPSSLASHTHLQGWVAVSRPKDDAAVEKEFIQQAGDDESLTDDMASVMANVRQLRKQNKELKDANQSWNKKWQELTGQWEVRVEHMRQEVAQHKAQAEDMRRKERQLQHDCERMVQNAKSQAHEEENMKEEALNKLHMATSQIRSLQDQVTELNMRLDLTSREKHNLEAELGVLKSQSPMMGHDRSNVDLKTEIEVLRQQLTLFEEDFDRERQDRAAAQSARDELQTNLENMTVVKTGLERNVKTLETKLRSQESNLQQTLRRTENLQTQNGNLKQQLQQLRESLQQVQTAAAFQQQQQLRYNPMVLPGFTPQIGQGFNPQTQQQQPAYNQPFVPMNNQVPVMNFPAEQVMMAAAAPVTPQAWQCQSCTYQNIPSRTVCEMCGKIKRQTGFSGTAGTSSQPILMSRDVYHPPPLPRGEDVPDDQGDLVTDDGLIH